MVGTVTSSENHKQQLIICQLIHLMRVLAFLLCTAEVYWRPCCMHVLLLCTCLDGIQRTPVRERHWNLLRKSYMMSSFVVYDSHW